jgi:hypothetical protein
MNQEELLPIFHRIRHNDIISIRLSFGSFINNIAFQRIDFGSLSITKCSVILTFVSV